MHDTVFLIIQGQTPSDKSSGNLKDDIETNFDVLLTVHLSIFISVFNQLDAHVSSTCARNM